MRSWDRDLAALRTGDGRPKPPRLLAELHRRRRRLVLTMELIREVTPSAAMRLRPRPMKLYPRKLPHCAARAASARTSRLYWVREAFYCSFGNRNDLASYVGLTPMPYQSGGVDRDRHRSCR